MVGLVVGARECECSLVVVFVYYYSSVPGSGAGGGGDSGSGRVLPSAFLKSEVTRAARVPLAVTPPFGDAAAPALPAAAEEFVEEAENGNAKPVPLGDVLPRIALIADGGRGGITLARGEVLITIPPLPIPLPLLLPVALGDAARIGTALEAVGLFGSDTRNSTSAELTPGGGGGGESGSASVPTASPPPVVTTGAGRPLLSAAADSDTDGSGL